MTFVFSLRTLIVVCDALDVCDALGLVCSSLAGACNW